jgi:dihydroxyacetone kinase-like predicted kinase
VSDLFLGVIAVAVVAMAVIQVTAIVVAMRTARRVGDVVARFEDDVRPIVSNLKTMSADAARTASIASTQAQRAEQLIGDLTARVNAAVAAVEATVVAPAREAYAILQGLLAALGAFGQNPPTQGRRPATSDEEDSLFIG